MKKAFLATIVALFALLAVMNFVSGSVDMGDLTDNFEVTVDGIGYDSYSLIGIEAGETIPIRVVFTAKTDAREASLKVWIDEHRSEVTSKTKIFELENGSTYSKIFSLTVPSDIDLTEKYTLRVRLSGEDEDGHDLDDEDEFSLKLQRESYNIEVLSVETPQTITPGSVIAVDVVLKNRGMHELEDVYVKASIPDLGIERKVYFGDIDPLDECEYEDECESNRHDAVERRIYLSIPNSAKAGIYNLEVEAYDADSTDTVKKSIVISGEGISEVFSGIASKTLDIGETVVYDLVMANSGNTLKVYNLVPEDVKGLIVEVDPIVTVQAGSSKTVKVSVKATESAEEGTHGITINVNSEDELVKQITFSANVEKEEGKAESSIVVLTIVLAIVFVVLLIILIVLLTRKPAAVESEETSYY